MKMEQVEKLTNEKLDLEAAKLNGWKRCDTKMECYYRGDVDEYGMAEEHTDNFSGGQLVPNYSGDLNVMHEVEEGMTEAEYNKYCDILWNMCHNASGKGGAINSTARQRAEAFVLMGKETK